jgi:DNA repair protein RecO (recombination protein O)
MIEKTRGIVLNQVKYSDSGIVVQFYTRDFGRQAFMIRGLRNKKRGRQNIFFQPLFIHELNIYYKESRGIQSIKEFSAAYSPSGIYSDIRKSCVALFLGEVLTAILREESAHTELFDFIEEAIVYFDKSNGGYSNFHVAFLAGLCSWLGFEPGTKTEESQKYFDMLNGIFVSTPPSHGNYATREVSEILALFFSASYEKSNEIPLTGALRNEVLEIILKYYSLHLPGIKKIKSLEVLKEVFS